MESPYVFISYNSLQKEQAEQMRETLKYHKIECWMAPYSIPGGSRYANEITSAIENCSAFILLLSPSAQRSHWVEIETHLAFEFRKVILPFVVEECELTGSFKLYLTNIQFYEAFRNEKNALSQLVMGIRNAMSHSCDGQICDSVETGGNRKNHFTAGKHWVRYGLSATVYFLGLCIPLFLRYYRIDFTLWMRIVYFIWFLQGVRWLLDEMETNPKLAELCFGTLQEEDLNMTTDEVYSTISSKFGNHAFISNVCPEGFVSYCKMRLIEFGSWDGKRINFMKVEFCSKKEYYDPSVFYLHTLSRRDQALRMLTHQGFVIKSAPVCFLPSTLYLSKGDIHVAVYHEKKILRCVTIYNCDESEIVDHFQGEWKNV